MPRQQINATYNTRLKERGWKRMLVLVPIDEEAALKERVKRYLKGKGYTTPSPRD